MKHGLTLKKLAELAKISHETIRRIEAGTGKPQKRILGKLQGAIKAVEGKPEPLAKPREVKPVIKRKVTKASPIELTNLDLELIQRVLNMSDRERVELLSTMI